MTTIRLVAFCLFSSLIAACGGGEDSPTSNPTSSGGGVVSTSQTYLFDKALEGVWQGSAPPNTAVFAMINNDGKFWLAYGASKTLPTGAKAVTTWNGFLTLDGFVHGTLKPSNGVVTASDLKEFTRTGKNYKLSLAGTYAAGSSFKATLSSTDASKGIDTKPAPSTSYIYGSTPRLSDLVGDWTGQDLVGNNVAKITVTTRPPGSSAELKVLVGTDEKCQLYGNVLPRISSIASQNLFDVKLSYDYAKSHNCSTQITGTAVSDEVKVTEVPVKSTSGSGKDAKFNITKNANQTYANASIIIAEPGSGYVAGDTITLSGSDLKGKSGSPPDGNDLTFTLPIIPFSGSGVAVTQKTADGKSEILIMLTSKNGGISFTGVK